MPLPPFASSADGRALAGVCAGIARSLGVDVTLVRLVFALLALAGGAGIVLYLALWAGRGRPARGGRSCCSSSPGPSCCGAVGVSDRAVLGIVLVAGGLAVAWRRGGSLRADAPALVRRRSDRRHRRRARLRGRRDAPARVLAPGAVAGGLLLVGGPWLWRLALERDAERSARIRSEEREDVAARVHDSVLQTLALIQRHAPSRRRVAALARRQERELRGWLYADRPIGDDGTSLVDGAVRRGRRRRGAARRPRSSSRARATPPADARSCSRPGRR